MDEFTRADRRKKHLARLSSRFRAVLGAFGRITHRSGGIARTCHYATEMAESLAAFLEADAEMTCECGEGLARIVGGGIDAMLCPICDEERFHELTH